MSDVVGGIRAQLIDVAERLAATRGIGAMTLREVQLESGQRNKSVVQYHFGSRDGLIGAVMDARMGPINARRLEWLEGLGDQPDLRSLVEALVRPLADLTVLTDSSYWARFLLQASFDPAFRGLVQASFTASSFRAVRAGLVHRLADIPRSLRQHRVDMMVGFMLVALSTTEEARDDGRLAPTTAARHVADLIDMCCGLLTAPPSGTTPPARAGIGLETAASHAARH